MTNDRWLASVHEAGHAVAAIELGGWCDGVLLTAEGGLAILEGVYQDRHAFAVAAGPMSEYLAEQYDPPIVTSVVSVEDVAANPPKDAPRDFALACSVADVPGVSRRSESDDRRLALWAIDGREDAPETWPRRIEFAKHIGTQIVQRNTSKILRLAEKLYAAGRVSRNEIESILEGKNDVVE